MKIAIILKIILAALFFLCLLDMPYGFYQLVRFLALLGFVLLAMSAYKEGKNELAVVFGGLALLFQPIIKISLGRSIWNIIDVVAGIWLIYLVYNEIKKNSEA